MGKFFESIPPNIIPWIEQQHVFWVATAPLTAEGHVNVSPKGVAGTFHVVDNKTCWYEDLTGSGIETVSHIRENGRITILFNAFVGPPRILRLFGKGTVHEIGSPEYEKYIPLNQRKPGTRSVIVIDIHKVGTSCGYAVPYFEFRKHRSVLVDWATQKELKDAAGDREKGIKSYWNKKNVKSIDGLAGLDCALTYDGPLPNVPVDAEAGTPGSTKSAVAPRNWSFGPIERNTVLAYVLGMLTVLLVSRIQTFLLA